MDFYGQTIFDRILGWSCADECSYGCMWRTVFAFLERGWPIPQFYGKWPFLRLFGMQEPASVIFSLLNFAMHVRLLRKFRREVRPDSPCYKLAHIFSLVWDQTRVGLFACIMLVVIAVSDLSQWLDLVYHIPHERLSINWAVGLCLCIFYRSGDTVLYGYADASSLFTLLARRTHVGIYFVLHKLFCLLKCG